MDKIHRTIPGKESAYEDIIYMRETLFANLEEIAKRMTTEQFANHFFQSLIFIIVFIVLVIQIIHIRKTTMYEDIQKEYGDMPHVTRKKKDTSNSCCSFSSCLGFDNGRYDYVNYAYGMDDTEHSDEEIHYMPPMKRNRHVIRKHQDLKKKEERNNLLEYKKSDERRTNKKEQSKRVTFKPL